MHSERHPPSLFPSLSLSLSEWFDLPYSIAFFFVGICFNWGHPSQHPVITGQAPGNGLYLFQLEPESSIVLVLDFSHQDLLISLLSPDCISKSDVNSAYMISYAKPEDRTVNPKSHFFDLYLSFIQFPHSVYLMSLVHFDAVLINNRTFGLSNDAHNSTSPKNTENSVSTAIEGQELNTINQ